jgi:hypothetical protein
MPLADIIAGTSDSFARLPNTHRNDRGFIMALASLKTLALSAALAAPSFALAQNVGTVDFGFTTTIAKGSDEDVYGQLPGGTWIAVEIDNGVLEEVTASAGDALPDDLLERLLPPPVREDLRYQDLARVTQVEFDDDGDFEIDGFDATGMRVELEFGPAGDLKEAKTEPDTRRSPDFATASNTLTEAGYTEIGFASRSGRHIDVIARNPEGALVMVRVDDSGSIGRTRDFQ